MWSSDLKYGPPARDWGSCVSGLVPSTAAAALVLLPTSTVSTFYSAFVSHTTITSIIQSSVSWLSIGHVLSFIPSFLSNFHFYFLYLLHCLPFSLLQHLPHFGPFLPRRIVTLIQWIYISQFCFSFVRSTALSVSSASSSVPSATTSALSASSALASASWLFLPYLLLFPHLPLLPFLLLLLLLLLL